MLKVTVEAKKGSDELDVFAFAKELQEMCQANGISTSFTPKTEEFIQKASKQSVLSSANKVRIKCLTD